MISKEFADKLQETFKSLDERISRLEDKVDHQLIEGLAQAAEEYEEDCKFSDFIDRNEGAFDKYSEPAKILYGEDFDVPSAVYDEVKGSEGYGEEGFDEAGKVQEILSAIDEKIDALTNLKEEVKEDAEDGELNEEQLAEEYAAYKNGEL